MLIPRSKGEMENLRCRNFTLS
uniref:Uncharacterized protein n=1 Tax=Lepeophtheirus salmonis TaxID=72036 RepID=A0A0K2V541_LEPSM